MDHDNDLRTRSEPGPALERAYRAALEAALVVRLPAAGHVEAAGADRLDLLHRLATNSVADLAPGSWRHTILTSALGRIVDRIQVLENRDIAHLITSPGRSEAVRDWLQGYIFFQDDVQLSLGPGWAGLITIVGPRARDRLLEVFSTVPELETGQFAAQDDALILAVDRPLPGFEIHTSNSEPGLSPGERDLDDDQLASYEAYQALRIEQGIPAPESEINTDVIPLEIGLQEEIDFAKGCYIGQEVIARMESRGQMAKRLVGLRLPERLEPGHELVSESMRAGKITSVAYSPANGWIGLALLSRRALDGTRGSLRLDDLGIEIEWQDLPIRAAAGKNGPP